jgi:hypothetical protein
MVHLPWCIFTEYSLCPHIMSPIHEKESTLSRECELLYTYIFTQFKSSLLMSLLIFMIYEFSRISSQY